MTPFRRALTAATLAATAATAATTLAGCDWIQWAFMNSIPAHGNASHNPDIYVYLGVDGLSWHTVKDAMADGAFGGPDWHLAKFITQFPGTSDASWTRITHTEKLKGYEFEYYNPETDSVVNHGLMGDALHLMPTFSETFLNFEFPYLRSFDVSANGYLSSVDAYRNTSVSLGNTLDNVFSTLGGRAETGNVFSAYMIEIDVLGHMTDADHVRAALEKLASRIDKFKHDHPERNFHFTIFSDHGMDFTNVPSDHMVEFDKELEKVGVKHVESLLNHDPTHEIYAIPIMHTRVSYLALHTHPDLIDEVAYRSSKLDSVDLAVARLKTPPRAPSGAAVPQWYQIWAEGKQTVFYGFDPATDKYYLPKGADYARIGIPSSALSFGADEDFKTMTDEELFSLTRELMYPDIFYRVRTALTPIGVTWPCDVMISFASSFGSLGFKVPGETTSAGFHGSLSELATVGTLLSSERELPPAVRADTLLEMFPRLKDHIAGNRLEYVPGDANAGLDYSKVK